MVIIRKRSTKNRNKRNPGLNVRRRNGSMIVVLVLSLIVPLLLAGNAPTALAAEDDPVLTDGDQFKIYINSSANRKNALPLEEQYVVSGKMFTFVTVPEGVEQVRFYLDHPMELLEDPNVAGTPLQVDTKAPFEFGDSPGNSGNNRNNGNSGNGRNNGGSRPFDTRTIPDGVHVLTAAADFSDGQTQIVNTTFEVRNGSPALVFRPRKISVKLLESESIERSIDIITTDASSTAYSISSDASWLTAESKGEGVVAPDTSSVTLSAEGMGPGVYTATLTVEAPGYEPGTMNVKMVVPKEGRRSASSGSTLLGEASPPECSPVACEQILVNLPYDLVFSQNHGGIKDSSNTIGTGFTHVKQPSNATGYMPQNLSVNLGAPGTFNITTTKGIAFAAENSQDNALGVGIDAPNQVSVISTTVLNPAAGSGKYEQGGLWFGNDEDNYVKLEVISAPGGTQIEFMLEVNGVKTAAQTTSNMSLSNSAVTLQLRADPGTRKIGASYSVNGGALSSIGELTAPAEFFSFDAAGIDPRIGTRSFGGVFATHRHASSPLVYTFDDFSVRSEQLSTPTGDGTFDRVSFGVSFPTSMVWGPDDRLYVTELFGTIHAITLDDAKQKVADEIITTLGNRLTLGITIDPQSTPENVILWVSHSSPSIDNGALNSSTITRLSGPGFTTRQDVITGLPRAIANHAVNSIHFGPDDKLYIAIGGNTGAGAPNTANTEFGTRAEQPLSAALLVADVRDPGFEGSCATPENTYGPAPCDVEVFSSGLRNMYDFVWHSNGHSYGPDNGLGVTGTYPASPTAPCEGFANPSQHNPGEQPDLLLRLEQGKYYGHPNQYRNECVFKDGSYQNASPLPNYTPAIYNLGAHRSSNGIIEYKSTAALNGALQGELLITNYSVGDNIMRVKLSPDGLSVVEVTELAGGFSDPLPITEGPDGTIYVGEFGTGVVTALIPVATGTWTTKQPAPVDLLDVGGAALGDKLYVLGGKTSSGPQRTMYIYDPQANAWTQGASLPAAYPSIENPAVVAYNGKLYAFGGSTDPFSGAVTTTAIYDPGNLSWTMLEPMPTGRGGATAQVIDNKIYVVGGMDASGASTAVVEIYDPASNTWTTAASMGTRRDNAGSAVLDGNLYVFGGRTRDANGTEVNPTLATSEMYDAGTDTWTPKAQMPTGRRTMVVGTLNGRAQVIGGERKADNSTFAENQEYDPVTDTWRNLTPMLSARHGAAAGTINGVVYVAAGGTVGGSSYSAINEAFSLAPVTDPGGGGEEPPPDDPDPLSPPTNLTATLSANGSTINLDWDDNTETDLFGYYVYRSEQYEGPYTKITEVRVRFSNYSDITAPAEATSYYFVTAIDTSDTESGPSNTAEATRPSVDVTPPDAPAGIVATTSQDGNTIDLDWSDNSDEDLLGYYVYRSDAAEGTFTKITPAVVTESAYSDETAPGGAVSHYYVTAVDLSNNESQPSSTVNAARPFNVLYSVSSNRSNAIALNGETVEGRIYVFTTPVRSTIVRVLFYLDDPQMTGNPRQVEGLAPYDFNGGSSLYAEAFSTETIANGDHTITAAVELQGGAVLVTHATFTVANGIAMLPGLIQAEDYNPGGEGVGYHDTTSNNQGGSYRNQGVDIQRTTDTGGGYNVGWIRTGEWLAYDVQVAETGDYTFTIRVATPNNNRQLHLELDGVDISGPITLPNTGGTQNWADVTTPPINLTSGTHQLKIVMDSDSFNINWISAEAVAAP